MLELELKIDKTVIDMAKEQVGMPPEGDFNITHFDYGINIMANLLKKFLEDTNFIGVSVSMIITLMIILILVQFYNIRVKSISIKMEFVM